MRTNRLESVVPDRAHRNPLRRLVIRILPIIPILLLVALIFKYAVDVPYWDQWDNEVLILNKIATNELRISDLLAQHNENRPVFPRIIWMAVSLMPTWDFRHNLALAFVFACLTSYFLYKLAQKTLLCGPINLSFAVFLANLLIFGTVQYENWLWGSQFPLFVPMLVLTAGLLVAGSSLSVPVQILTCAALCTVSTFTFTNGMLCWFLLLALLLINLRQCGHSRMLWVLVYSAAMVVNMIIYFWGYQSPGTRLSMGVLFADPIGAANYFLILLGSGLGYWILGNQAIASMLVGFGLLSAFGATIAYVVWSNRDKELLMRALPFYLIAIYAIISCLAITVGRIGLGIGEAFSSRHITFSVYLPVALIFLFLALSKDTDPSAAAREWLKPLASSLSAILIVFALSADVAGVQKMKDFSEHLEKGRIALALMEILPRQPLQLLHPKPETVITRARLLIKDGYLKIALVQTPNMTQIEDRRNIAGPPAGYLEGVFRISDSQYAAKGWASLPSTNRPADAVILAYSDKDETAIAFDYTLGPFQSRRDVANAVPAHMKERYKETGWAHRFSLNELPVRDLEISAWAFDASTGKVFRLRNSFVLGNGTTSSQ